ncbi:MAG: tetratricopeptide repeat protein [Candidatus Heimdallarchaeota archaeon]|nr:MAG: tetratricopeptide repeat protein [Candidatus Heimdallarchaeota archaeon]
MIAQQLEQIEQLIAQAEFKEAQTAIELLESSEQLTADDRLKLRYLQSTLYLTMGRLNEGFQVAEELLEASKKVDDPLLELDTLINIIWALGYLGKIEEGFQLTRRGEKLLEILTHQPGLNERHAAFLYRKGLLFFFKGELDQALTLLEASLVLREEMGDKRGIIESLWDLSLINFRLDLDRALEYGQKCLALSEAIGDRQGLARSHLCLGAYYYAKGELESATRYLQKSLVLSEAIGDQVGLGWALQMIGYVYHSRAELAQALEYFQKGLAIAETIGDQFSIAMIHSGIGFIYADKGELDMALEHEQKNLAIAKVFGNLRGVAGSFNNIGCCYGELGDFQAATDYFEKSIKISRKIDNDTMMADSFYQIIRFFVNDLPPKTVRSYLENLEGINKRLGDHPRINHRYRLAKAIVLKASGSLADKVAAQTTFREVASEENVASLELTVEALINLSDLLLLELETTGYKAAFTELDGLVRRLLALAKEQSSYTLLVEAYLIQSKLQLLQLNLQKTHTLLTQAYLIAQEKGLDRLSQIAATELDSLVTQLSTWERIIEQKPSMSKIIKLTQVNDLISRMIHKRRYHNEAELLAYAENARQLVQAWEK